MHINKVILYTLRISNSGSVPIKKDDFERPILVNIPDDTKIYLARLKKKLPENLAPKYELNNNKLLIEPLLLNSDEGFEMELFSSSNVYPTIDARIVGISNIKKTFPDSKRYIIRTVTLVLSFLLMVFYGKYGRLAVSTKVIYLSKLSIRLGNVLLALICCISSYILLESLTDIANNRILVYSVSVIACLLGFRWALNEERYIKKMQPIADTLVNS